jgi:hypothetical protein
MRISFDTDTLKDYTSEGAAFQGQPIKRKACQSPTTRSDREKVQEATWGQE